MKLFSEFQGAPDPRLSTGPRPSTGTLTQHWTPDPAQDPRPSTGPQRSMGPWSSMGTSMGPPTGVRLSVCRSVCDALSVRLWRSCEHDIPSANAPRLTKFVGHMYLLGGQVHIENRLHSGHLGFSRWSQFKNLDLLITRELSMIERKTRQVFLGLGLLSLLKLFSNFEDGSILGFSRWPPFKT